MTVRIRRNSFFCILSEWHEPPHFTWTFWMTNNLTLRYFIFHFFALRFIHRLDGLVWSCASDGRKVCCFSSTDLADRINRYALGINRLNGVLTWRENRGKTYSIDDYQYTGKSTSIRRVGSNRNEKLMTARETFTKITNCLLFLSALGCGPCTRAVSE
jgi:hypothetical protein